MSINKVFNLIEKIIMNLTVLKNINLPILTILYMDENILELIPHTLEFPRYYLDLCRNQYDMVIRNRFAIPTGDEIDTCTAGTRRCSYLSAHAQLHIPRRYTISHILRGLVVG